VAEKRLEGEALTKYVLKHVELDLSLAARGGFSHELADAQTFPSHEAAEAYRRHCVTPGERFVVWDMRDNDGVVVAEGAG
jgi:hypothetical protein